MVLDIVAILLVSWRYFKTLGTSLKILCRAPIEIHLHNIEPGLDLEIEEFVNFPGDQWAAEKMVRRKEFLNVKNCLHESHYEGIQLEFYP